MERMRDALNSAWMRSQNGYVSMFGPAVCECLEAIIEKVESMEKRLNLLELLEEKLVEKESNKNE